jgi:hypothetical protein
MKKRITTGKNNCIIISQVIIFNSVAGILIDRLYRISYNPFIKIFYNSSNIFSRSTVSLIPDGGDLPMSPINTHNERIIIETDRHRVEGDVTLLPHEDFLDALFKYLNRGDQEFLPLTNVEAVAIDGSADNWNAPALNLEIKHIRIVFPQRK